MRTFHASDQHEHCARSHSKHSISPYCFHAVFFPLCFPELLPEDTTVSKQLLQFRQQAANIVPPPPSSTPPPPAPPTRTHPRHPTLGEKYKASLVWEHRDLSDAALYHSILPLSHDDSGTVSSSGGASLSPLTFSQPLSPWHDAQTAHCTARPATPSKWMWICWYGLFKKKIMCSFVVIHKCVALWITSPCQKHCGWGDIIVRRRTIYWV